MEKLSKAEFARRRNWQKRRLLGGFHLDTTILSEPERELYTIVRERVNTLVENWDSESAVLGLKVDRYDLHTCKEDGSDKDVQKNLTLKQAKLWGKAAIESGLLAGYVKVEP